MKRRISKSRQTNYKRKHKNAKNAGILAEFATFLDNRIDKEFNEERKRLQNLIAQYTRLGLHATHTSLSRTLTVSLEIPDPVSRREWEQSYRDVVNGIGLLICEAIAKEDYSDPRYRKFQ